MHFSLVSCTVWSLCLSKGRQGNYSFSLMYCNAWYFIVLHCTVLHWTVLHCTVLHCTVLNCTVLNCTVLKYNLVYSNTALSCNGLYSNELKYTVFTLWITCTVIYFIVLNFISLNISLLFFTVLDILNILLKLYLMAHMLSMNCNQTNSSNLLYIACLPNACSSVLYSHYYTQAYRRCRHILVPVVLFYCTLCSINGRSDKISTIF